MMKYLMICICVIYISSYEAADVAAVPHADVTKVVCQSPLALKNTGPLRLECPKNFGLVILKAVSGLQSRKICPQILTEELIMLEDSCEEALKTTKLVKEKCNGKENCTLDLTDQLPHNCKKDLFSYMQVTFRCASNRVSSIPSIPVQRQRTPNLPQKRIPIFIRRPRKVLHRF